MTFDDNINTHYRFPRTLDRNFLEVERLANLAPVTRGVHLEIIYRQMPGEWRSTPDHQRISPVIGYWMMILQLPSCRQYPGYIERGKGKDN